MTSLLHRQFDIQGTMEINKNVLPEVKKWHIFLHNQEDLIYAVSTFHDLKVPNPRVLDSN